MNFSKQEDNLKSRDFREDFAREVLQDSYHIVKKLDEEEFETVYLAESKDSSVSTKYLVQQFTPQYLSQAQLAVAQDLFKQEAAVLEALGKHPQIPSIHDYFETQGQFFVVQEFIFGQSFQEELNEAKPYSETETIEFLNNILPVLQFIHENNYIHRDIKPSHLMRNDANQKIYLINFYSIKEKINPQNLDITGQFMPHLTVGTQGYIPMEQHLGKPEFCSDIYALGIVVIQALTKIKLNQLNYDDDNNPVWRHFLPNISNFSPQFLDIIDTMVRCNHRKRYQSAIAILGSLKQSNYSHKFPENSSIVQNSEAAPHFTERILIQQNPESTPKSPEPTLIQQTREPTPQTTENTLIIDPSETSSQPLEHTLIIQDNDIESTRIINYQTDSNHTNNNTQKDRDQSMLKILVIIGGLLMIVMIVIVLSILKNNQKSAPQNSSLLPFPRNEDFIIYRS